MTAVLEPTARRGFLSIPAEPWIPVQYGTGAIPLTGAPDTAAATPTPARAVSGLPGLMKAALDMLAAALLLVLLTSEPSCTAAPTDPRPAPAPAQPQPSGRSGPRRRFHVRGEGSGSA